MWYIQNYCFANYEHKKQHHTFYEPLKWIEHYYCVLFIIILILIATISLYSKNKSEQ